MAPRGSSVFRRILQLVVDAESARKAKAALKDALDKGTDAKGVKKNLRAIDGALATLKRTAIGLGASFLAVFSARKLIEYADTWKLIAGRLKLVTDGAEGLRRVQSRLFDIAQRTRSQYTSTAALFSRIALNAEDLGRSEQELLDLTEAVNKAIQIGGGSAQEASAGVIQLSQALASGVLRGDEFRSVMENMPGLARAMADGLGVPIGQLRAMAMAGELTADVVIDAILRMKGAIDEDFKAVPITVGAALTQLGNEIMAFVGAADEGTGASNIFADAILAVAQAAEQARGALERLNASRTTDAGGVWVNRGGVDIFIPASPQRRGPVGPNIETQDIDRLRAAGFEQTRPRNILERFQALVGRLESDRTQALVKLKAASQATQEEIAELNRLYGEGNAFLKDGNLTLEQRARLVSALTALGFKEAELQTQEELNRLEDQRVKMLAEAHDLGIATAAEEQELLTLYNRMSAALASGNLELRERLRLAEDLKIIADTLGFAVPARPAPRPDVPDQLAGRRDREGNLIIRAPHIPLTPAEQEEQMRELADEWVDRHAVMLSAAQNTALGFANAWQDAFRLVMTQGAGVAGFMEGLFRGMAGAVLGGLAQIAGAKVVENLALAFQALGMGWAQTLVGNFAGPAIGSKSAGFHFAAAAGWAALGGAAGAAQGALAGGGSAGLAGGLPSGARDPAGRIADRFQPQQVIHITQYIDGIDPDNGSHQVLIGKANVKWQQRKGSTGRRGT